MNVSAVGINDVNSRKNLFIRYANQFMNFKANQDEEPATTVTKPDANSEQKASKVKGIETLTIFPKQVIDGKMIITA